MDNNRYHVSGLIILTEVFGLHATKRYCGDRYKRDMVTAGRHNCARIRLERRQFRCNTLVPHFVEDGFDIRLPGCRKERFGDGAPHTMTNSQVCQEVYHLDTIIGPDEVEHELRGPNPFVLGVLEKITVVQIWATSNNKDYFIKVVGK